MEVWAEIAETISKNKLRTFLTSLSVAWGIFMLIVLLGSGRGLENGIENAFQDDAVNSIWIYSGQTSLPFKGLQAGRDLQFTNSDYEFVRDNIPGVEHITARKYIDGDAKITYKNKSKSYEMRGIHPDHKYLEKTLVTSGRFINDKDYLEYRKTVVLGDIIVLDLFGSEDPIGKYVAVNDVPFKVVGMYHDEGGENERSKVYLPISTSQRTFNGANRIAQIMFTTGDASFDETQKMVTLINEKFSVRHKFDPEDKRAIYINNNIEHYLQIKNLLGGINLFVWIIGIFTIIAGIVGVSNIMLIIVKDRTREIGIRKAIGAKPSTIINQIILESIIITSISGYTGLVLGMLVLEGLGKIIPPTEMFRNPEIDLNIAIRATLLLIVSGAIAGYIPARRAASIKPVEALRQE